MKKTIAILLAVFAFAAISQAQTYVQNRKVSSYVQPTFSYASFNVALSTIAISSTSAVAITDSHARIKILYQPQSASIAKFVVNTSSTNIANYGLNLGNSVSTIYEIPYNGTVYIQGAAGVAAFTATVWEMY